MTAPSLTAPRPGLSADRSFFGHPRGLAILAFTEGWISFSYYGMQSLLVLYITSQLLRRPSQVLGFADFRAALGMLYGPLHGEALAAAIVGLFGALIWATPLLGGILADRLLGRTRIILLGAALLTLGHLLMGFEASFVIALACLVVGLGCTGTIKAQVGGLYAPDDPRRADAFQIYTSSAACAVVLAPLVCGTLGERVAFRWGFAAAAAGMLLGLLTYLAGRRWLPSEPPRSKRAATSKLTRVEWRRVGLLLALLPVLALAMVGNQELFNGYLVWAKRRYDLALLGWTMPVTWLLSLDAMVGIAAMLLSILFWRWLGRPLDDLVKMTIGTGLLAAAPLILAAACWRSGGHSIGLGWALAFHLVNNFGFANLYPIGMALFSRAAPARLGATLVNAYVLHLFLANLAVGWLAGLLGQVSDTNFWLLHAGLISLAALILAGLACAPIAKQLHRSV